MILSPPKWRTPNRAKCFSLPREGNWNRNNGLSTDPPIFDFGIPARFRSEPSKLAGLGRELKTREFKIQKFKTQNSKFKTQNSKFKIQNYSATLNCVPRIRCVQ
jgi:hypothetical protein